MRYWKYAILLLLILVVLFLPTCSTYEPLEVQFLENPCIEPVEGFTYKTCMPLAVKVNQEEITVPYGFTTDLASIPRLYWNIFPPQYASFIWPAIIHDYLYVCPGNHDRKFVDHVFYTALREQGVGIVASSTMYYAVRMFGAPSFMKGQYCVGNYAITDISEFEEKDDL